MALSIVFLASLVVLVQSFVSGGNSTGIYWHLAIACSAMSMLCCFLVLLFLGPWPLHAAAAERIKSNVDIISLGLALLWSLGASIFTFKSPFNYTGNGYFATWTCLVVAWLLAVKHLPKLREPFEMHAKGGGRCLTVLLLASAAVFAEAIIECQQGRGFNGQLFWMLACAGVSLTISLLLLLPCVIKKVGPIFKYLALLLVAMWMAAAFVGTFLGPFQATGNGYFGCWVAFASSVMLACGSWRAKLVDVSMTEATRDAAVTEACTLPLALQVLVLASLVTLTASSLACDSERCKSYEIWAMVCSALSLCVSATVATLKLIHVGDRVASYLPLLSLGLVALWVAGAGVMTFAGPFTSTGNGYFGAWAALVSSVRLAHDESYETRRLAASMAGQGFEVTALLIAAETLLVQAALDGGRGTVGLTGQWVWAIICPAMTALLCPVLLADYLHVNFEFTPVIACVLLAMWTVAAFVLTMSNPYSYTGNGYFACWAGFIAALLLCRRQLSNLPEICGRKASTVEGDAVTIGPPTAEAQGTSGEADAAEAHDPST